MSAMLRKSIAAYAVMNSNVPPLIAVVRLYEKAVIHAHHARSAVVMKKFDEHSHHTERCIAILAGLDSILDMKKGGDVAQELRRFYRTIIGRLGNAAARRDPLRAMDAAIVPLTIMARTWRDIADQR